MATATSALYDAMATHGPSSPAFIKPEPDDFYGSPKFNKNPPQFHAQNGNNNYGPWQGHTHDVNPSEISMNGNHGMSQYVSASQNMPNNFVTHNSMVSDDDLISSFGVSNNGNANDQHAQQNQQQQFSMMNSFSNGFNQQMQASNNHLNAFSNTPDGAPIQSPFTNGFDFNNWQANSQQQQQPHRMSQQMSRSISGHGMQDPHGPMTPMSPSNNGMQIGHHVHAGSIGQHSHQRNPSNNWENSLGSGYSQPFDSPIGSPATGPVHSQISEVLKSGSSVPSASARSGKQTTTAEMKKAKRRASHNEVERRRRNHINDRITELADLVPKHRLEDEAVRRSNASNAAMPLNMSGTGISPPGSSGLAGSHGRRAASVSQGPMGDDKDKGPAKGEVLDGAVGWTRDLLWLMNIMLSREREMRQTIQQLNGNAPSPYSEDELRMLSETKAAIQHNVAMIQSYTRRNGTELYVPGHTNHSGERVAAPAVQEPVSPSSMFDFDTPQPDNGNGGAPYINYMKEEDDLPGMEMS